MAIVKDSKALALDIIALKTKLNNELLRRCGQNSIWFRTRNQYRYSIYS